MKGQTNKKVIRGKLQRDLRNHMTDAERRLWSRIKGRQLSGHKFRRQHPWLDYVLDFVCFEAKVVIEVDGGQHADSSSDRGRDEKLIAAGFRVLRFWNNEVLSQTDAVVEVILEALKPHPVPPLEGEGDGASRPPRPHRPGPIESQEVCPGSFPLQGGGQEGDGVPQTNPYNLGKRPC